MICFQMMAALAFNVLIVHSTCVISSYNHFFDMSTAFSSQLEFMLRIALLQ